MKSLIIVESRAKTQSIGKIVGDGYVVSSCLGHVFDLPESELGVDVEKDFKPSYVQVKGKEKLIKQLQKDAEGVKAVILATDPDREGESIAWHLARLFPGKKIYRMRFNEITEKAIREALGNLAGIDEKLVNAQQARRVLDRLVGYKISPLLWRALRKSGLSAGRVQSVALKLICEREKEIEGFKPEESWKLTGLFARLESGETFKAVFVGIKDEKIKLKNEEEAKKRREELIKHRYHVERVTKKLERRNPYPPYTTSTMQQDAVKRLEFPVARTMAVAQQLYEGINVGTDGTVGLITYMRTDSPRISSEAAAEARDFIHKKFGDDYLPAKAPQYTKKKSPSVQDAHEAVRPTSVFREPSSIADRLSPEQLKLYALIWNRFVASQMKPAVVEVVSVDIMNGGALFRASGTTVKFDGFYRVYKIVRDENEEEKEGKLPELLEKEALRLDELKATQHFTKPPPRYNEATLIRTLEEKGIGRPSTYVPTIETVKKRGYVEMEKRIFHPTKWGFIVTSLLSENFKDIMNYEFTAQMEENLDKVESGDTSWVTVVDDFYDTFSKEIEEAAKNMKYEEKVDAPCEKCGSQMVLRGGRYGLFYACSGYPECRNTKPFTGKETLEDLKSDNASRPAPQETGKECEKCGKPLLLREGKYGKFLACSGYPKCRFSMPYGDKSDNASRPAPQETDKKCGKCGKPLLLREGRYGKFLACSGYPKCRFSMPYGDFKCPRKGCDGQIIKKFTGKRKAVYGCTKYPDCDFISWYAPVDKKCPDCGTFLMRKKSKDKITLQCASDECGKVVEEKSGAGVQEKE